MSCFVTRGAWRALFSLFLAVLASSCASMERSAAQALVSPEEENRLGAQIKTELEQKEGIRYVGDAEITGYVSGVVSKLIELARPKQPQMAWQVHVIDNAKTVNAFATPGGYMYVFTGLLLAAENEAELASVMAHETGHVLARHSARRLVSAYGLQAIAAAALGQNPGLLARIAAAVVGQGVLLKNSRRDETEADELGARYAHAAGYDATGLTSFFGKLQAREGRGPGFLKYLSDHPSSQDRIDHVSRFIARRGLTGGAQNAEPYQQMKARLGAESPSIAGVPPAVSAPPPAVPR